MSGASQDPELGRLLSPMTDREVELDAPAFQVDRQRVLARMALAHGRADQVESKPERPRWVGYAVMAAAAVTVLAVGGRLWSRADSAVAGLEVMVSQGTATRLGAGANEAVAPQQRVQIAAAGDLETAADSKARLRAPDGLEIELQSQTRVGLGELAGGAGQLKLLAGVVRCTIPHRTVEHAFRVVTPDVTVVDVGTVFTVSVDGPNHVTRVTVDEGEVSIRSAAGETRLRAPSSWASAPSLPKPPSAVPVAPSLPELAPSASSGPSSPGVHSAKPTGTLAQEAQLLRQGLAAERQGHSADAIASLTQLIHKYPHSPLVPDARAALQRVEAGRH